MKFKELIVGFTPEEMADFVIELYPDMESSREGYVKVAGKLLKKRPAKTKMEIVLTEVHDEFDGETEDYIDVSGADDEEPFWAIEYTPWKEWLGMEIVPSKYPKLTIQQIIGYCLWEMTWSGFDERSIQRKIGHIRDIADELQGKIDGELQEETS